MLVDEGEAETHAVAHASASGVRTAGEPFEDHRALLGRHARPAVLDRDLHGVAMAVPASRGRPTRGWRRRRAPGRSRAGSRARGPSGACPRGRCRSSTSEATATGMSCVRASRLDGVRNELRDLDLFEVEPSRSAVDTRDLEQILDQSLEASDVGDEEVEGRLRPLGHLVTAGSATPRSTRTTSSRATAARG